MGLWPSAPHAAVSSTDREAALWEMEEYQLQERHQLVKQQLKDQYFLQRHELLRKHEKVRRPRDGHHLGTTGAPRGSQGMGRPGRSLGMSCLDSRGQEQGTRAEADGPSGPSVPRDVLLSHVSLPFPCPAFPFSLSHALGYLQVPFKHPCQEAFSNLLRAAEVPCSGGQSTLYFCAVVPLVGTQTDSPSSGCTAGVGNCSP